MRIRGRNMPGRPGPSLAAALIALVATAVAFPAPASAELTLIVYPPALVSLDDNVTVAWAEVVDCRLEYGRAPGVYTGATNSHGVGSLTFSPASESMAPGVYYCVVRATAGGDCSGEFGLIVESPVFPVPTAPQNGGVLHETTTALAWDPVEGVPYYHVVVSDSDISLVEENGQTTLTGANIIWQAITSGTAIQYGAIDPSGHFVASNGESPPLMSGFDYRWLILNNYGNHPLLTSLAGAGLAGFTVDVPASMIAPALLSPADSLSVVEDVIEFAWQPVEGAVGYRLYVYQKRSWGGGEASYPVWSGPASVPAAQVNVGSFLVTGEYSWRVVALNQSGHGAPSELRRFAYSTETGTADITSVTTTGQPVPQVMVEVNYVSGGITVLPAVTDGWGIAQKTLAPGSYEFHATKPGFADTTVTGRIEAGQTTAVPIVMKRASARLRGEVLDGLGQSVFDATVVASGNGSVVECMTDASGAFAVQLDAGLWEVHAEKSGYTSSDAETVGLSAGEYAELAHSLIVTGTPGTVTGSVLNQAGTPVIGATVWARNGDALCPAMTNASGRFSLTLAPGTWLLWAERTGFRPSSARTAVVAPGSNTVVDPPISLVPVDSAIMGRVTDGQNGVAGALVVASPLAGDVSETVTNGYGEFVLLPPPATYVLTASADGFGTAGPFQISTESGGSFTGVELLVLPFESVVEGTVLAGGAPIAGARVTGGAAAATTDAGGAFSLALPPGLRAISAWKTGYFPGEDVPVATSAGQSLSGLSLSLATGASSVSGSVTHAGMPVPNARISASSGDAATGTKAGPDGAYEVFVESGEWTVTATADGFAASRPETVTVAPAQAATGVDFALEATWAIVRGSVWDPQVALAGASIVLRSEGGGVLCRTSSSSDGSFSVRVPPGRPLVVEAAAPLHGSRRASVPALADGATGVRDFVLPRWSGAVEGVVKDEAGSAVAGARVVAAWGDSAVVATGHDGRYMLWLDDGLYDIRAESPGHRPAFRSDIEVVSGEHTPIDVTLDGVFGSIEGTVSDSLSGQAVPGALVTAMWAGGGASAVTSGDGHYRVERVLPGPVEVRFVKAGYRKHAAAMTIEPETAHGLSVSMLGLSGTIGGSVRDDAGGGIVGVSVRAKLGGAVAATCATDDEGGYLLVGLDPDEVYCVHASKGGFYESSENPLLDVPTATLDADFVLLAADGAITGRVLDAGTLEPLEGASIDAENGLGHFGSAMSGADGSFTIPALAPAGLYSVSARLYGYRSVVVEGVAPTTQGLAIELPRNFARIAGRIVPDGPDLPIGEIEIVATSTSFGGLSRATAPDEIGAYEIAEVRPGSYVVSVSGGGCVGTPAQVQIQLEEGAVVAGLDFVVERASITRVEIDGPSAVRAGAEVVFAGDAITDGDRLVDTDLVWSLSPGSAGTIESPAGRFICAPDYLGEIVVRATDPASGIVGRLAAGVYAEITPATEGTYRDSTGMLIRIPAGAVTETRSLLLTHEELSDVRRFGRDFEIRGPEYHLKPDGLTFTQGREPELVLPVTAGGTGIARWNRALLKWNDAGGSETPAGLETPIGELGEYATIASSLPLAVSGLRAEPNPFSPEVGPVTISYDLSSDDARMPFVTVTIYNLAARTVCTPLKHEAQGKGRQSIQWDGLTDDGETARNGRYVVEVRAEDPTGEASACATLVLVK
jgi:hypothetical protein